MKGGSLKRRLGMVIYPAIPKAFGFGAATPLQADKQQMHM